MRAERCVVDGIDGHIYLCGYEFDPKREYIVRFKGSGGGHFGKPVPGSKIKLTPVDPEFVKQALVKALERLIKERQLELF